MKISNETKIGALTAIAITTLILGFNYLKGTNLTERRDKIYAVFPNVEGLVESNPVFINGLQVGKVSKLEEKDPNISGIVVTISLAKEVNIPDNSLAHINSELLQTTSVVISLGGSSTYIRNGDTLRTKQQPGLMTEVKNSLNPALTNINKTLTSLNELIMNLNSTLDPSTKGNLQTIIRNLTSSSQSLDKLLNAERGALAKSLDNMQQVTSTLAKKDASIDSTINNLHAFSGKLSRMKLEETLETAHTSMQQLEKTVGKMNSPQSSLGALLSDRQLYDEIRQTNRSLTTLLDDLRMHPKRYVNISVFGGKKEKSGPLMSPIYDSTLKQRQ